MKRREKVENAATPLDIAVRRSVAMLFAERLWRLCVALSTLALAFLALSFAGLWREVGPHWRMLGVAVFAQAALFLILKEIWRGRPGRGRALARLDAGDASGLRPAASLDDALGNGGDAATDALWAAHRRRLEEALQAKPIAPPHPETARRDPYALRALALLAAVAAAFVAGGDKTARLRAAFDWEGAGFSAERARFDAWLDPPPYTGRTQLTLEEKDIGGTREAPVNSILHVRFAGKIETEGALTEMRDAGAGGEERSFKLTGAARLILPDGRAFGLAALPDNPPSIEFTGPPRLNLRGSLTLSYKTDDDYGVIEAQALLSRPNGRRALVPPPQLPLTLPQGANGRGEAETTLDLSDSPWAGARAHLTLKARDEGGGEGFSEAIEIMLPQRHFRKPLARALAEQRRILALDPDDVAKVRIALDALSLAPDLFDTPSSIYLGLRQARRGLDGPRSDDELRETADLLWAMALSLEGADVLQAERDLREAQRKLREAIERGASEEEIARLTQEMREAMGNLLGALAQQNARDPQAERSRSGEAREITQEDLEKLLDEMNAAAKAGDTERAEKLLNELTALLENLQMAQNPGEGRGMQKGGQGLSELDALSREQQQLRDETFQGEKSTGRTQADRGAAADKQRALRQRLEQQQGALRRSPEGAPEELDEAERAMKEAEQALGQGPAGAGKAVDAQGRALQALRRGADALARRGEGQEGEDEAAEGAGKAGGRQGRASGSANTDPLGRVSGSRGGADSRSRYDPLGLPPAQRARRLQEEVRKRLGQPERTPEELDYLQRLLKR